MNKYKNIFLLATTLFVINTYSMNLVTLKENARYGWQRLAIGAKKTLRDKTLLFPFCAAAAVACIYRPEGTNNFLERVKLVLPYCLFGTGMTLLKNALPSEKYPQNKYIRTLLEHGFASYLLGRSSFYWSSSKCAKLFLVVSGGYLAAEYRLMLPRKICCLCTEGNPHCALNRCGHQYHNTCIDPWKLGDSNFICPKCIFKQQIIGDTVNDPFEISDNRKDEGDKEEINCSICLDNRPSHEILLCGHRFHKDCLLQWLKNDNSCPLCRRRLT